MPVRLEEQILCHGCMANEQHMVVAVVGTDFVYYIYWASCEHFDFISLVVSWSKGQEPALCHPDTEAPSDIRQDSK